MPTTQLAAWQRQRLTQYPKYSFLIDSKNADPKARPTTWLLNQPAFRIRASTHKGFPKAVLIERSGARTDGINLRSAERPAWTIKASISTDGKGGDRSDFINAWIEDRVLSLNLRALARLQSFPDSYLLPESTAVAGQIIGNAVPPSMAREIVCSTIFPLLG